MSNPHPPDIPVIRSQWEAWWKELEGPIHGKISTIRGMCSDAESFVAIDKALAELDDAIYKLRCAIQFPIGRPTEADLDRARELAEKHGW